MAHRWLDIATAPKDGTRVLVWRPHESDDHVAHADVDYWGGNTWWRSRRYQQPTHWMPMLAPPALSKATPQGGEAPTPTPENSNDH